MEWISVIAQKPQEDSWMWVTVAKDELRWVEFVYFNGRDYFTAHPSMETMDSSVLHHEVTHWFIPAPAQE